MNSDDELKKRLKKRLESRPIDASTRDALRAARHAALDSTEAARPRTWIPATAIGLALVLVASALLLRGIDDVQMPAMAADDLAVIASEDELELFEELEFYLWYEQENQV